MRYKAERCTCCGQTKTYLLGLDKGSAQIVIAILNIVSEKGVNEVHPANEIDMTGKRKWMLTNLSKPRFHGLIAFIDDKPGHYCLTRKAGDFLRRARVPRYAIISKVTGHQEGYLEGEKDTVTITDLLKEDAMWMHEIEQKVDTVFPKNERQSCLL